MKRIVLAFSGSPGAAASIAWLKEHHQAEVITATIDLGGGTRAQDLRERALGLGAVRAHVIERRDDFARDYLLPSLKAGALADPLVTEIARPLVATTLVDVARTERVATIACGGAAIASDRAPLARAIQTLQPELRVLTPARDSAATGTSPLASDFTITSNLFGRSIVFGAHADPSQLLQSALAVRKARRPARPALVNITFERGMPVAINDVTMPLVDLIESLTAIAGAHGVGRVERSQRSLVEAPAAVVLHAAHASLQERVTSPELQRLSQLVGRQYAGVIHDGLWFTPAREAFDAFVNRIQDGVTGVVRLELCNGRCEVLAPQSSTIAAADAARNPHETGSSLATR